MTTAAFGAIEAPTSSVAVKAGEESLQLLTVDGVFDRYGVSVLRGEFLHIGASPE